ncbi:MAG: AsmA family protein [Gammaproteobacteria bacterium]
MVGVLLLVLAGLGVFLAGFDLNEYKGEIVKAAREATGRDFEITGDIGFKASLIPTISVEGVRLGNAEWAQHANMLEVDRFEARVQLLPLLSGTIKIHHVLVDGATLILEQDKSGRGNWAFDTVDETPEPGAETSGTAPAFDVRSIVVRDSRIEYRATDEQAVVVIVPDMTLSPQGFGKPLSLKAALTYNEMPIAAAAELAPIGRLLDNEPYNLDPELEVAEVEIDLSGFVAAPLDGTGIALEFTVSVNDTDVLPADMQKTLAPHLPLHLSGKATGGGEAYAIENLQMTAGESDLSGAITIDLGDDVPGVNIVANSKQLMLPTAETEATKETAPDRVFSTDPLPLDGLAAANVKLRANFGKIQMGSTTISAVELSVELDDRVLEIEMPKA